MHMHIILYISTHTYAWLHIHTYTHTYIYIYIYIYTRFAYGALRRLWSRTKYSSKQCTDRSRAISKARAMISSAELRRRKRSMLEQWFRRNKKQARAVMSSAQWRRRKKKHARAVISNARRGQAALGVARRCSSSDFGGLKVLWSRFVEHWFRTKSLEKHWF